MEEFIASKLQGEHLIIHNKILYLLEGKSHLIAEHILEAVKQSLYCASIVTIPSFPVDPS
jgi:hypothetical protein